MKLRIALLSGTLCFVGTCIAMEQQGKEKSQEEIEQDRVIERKLQNLYYAISCAYGELYPDLSEEEKKSKQEEIATYQKEFNELQAKYPHVRMRSILK